MKKSTILFILLVFTISVFSQTNTWQGDVSSNWHTAGNWSLNHVPTSSEDVIIPDVPGFNPNVYSIADCRDLTIETGANLNLYNSVDIYINRDAFIEGTLVFNNSGIDFWVYDDITWLSGSSVTANITSLSSGIYIYDDWTFEAGSNVDLTDIDVVFVPYGTSSSIIECNSSNSSFDYIYMNKSTGGTVLLSGASSQDMDVSHGIEIGTETIFYSYSSHNIVIAYYFGNHGHFQLVNGGLVITSGNNPLQFNSGDFLNNLEFTSEWATDLIQGNAVINGDLTMNGYGLEFEGTLELGGHFDNNAGSLTDINQITFNGDDIQNVYDLDCDTLILDKAAGELRFPAETSTCNNYDWEQGLYRVNGGTFIINDLVDDGIFGTISITAGQLDIHQDTDQYIDLNCTFFMTGGECNIYGGKENSWWSYAGNTSITMYDGILDFKDNGIIVYNSGYTFNENISGGFIKTTGDFVVERTNYNPTGGVLRMVGPNDCIVQHSPGSNLGTLEIDKDSKGYAPKNYQRNYRDLKTKSSSKDSQVTAGSPLDINGSFIINTGTFTPSVYMTVAETWHNWYGDVAFNEGTSEVIFDGDEQGYFWHYDTFYNVTINKTYASTGGLVVLGISGITVLNDLNILDGSLTLNPSANLVVGNNILIETNAGLYCGEEDPFPCTIDIGGDWQNNNTSFNDLSGFRPGSSVVEFNGTSIQNIISNCPIGDFDGLRINSTGSVQSAYNLHIDNIIINGGVLVAPPEIYVGRLWGNNVGESAFDEGVGLVVFNGSSDANCHSEEFYHMEIDKPGATLRFPLASTTVSCSGFDWTTGGIELWEGSTFIVNDLVDDGIYGDITVNEGALLSLTQGTGPNEYVDLNGNLTIDGGEVHVYGGTDHSFWTYNGDASITMTNDAKLYFEDVGIHIGLKEPFTFSENISGGEIHTASNFIVSRDNFTPTASHLYMDGPDDAILNIVAGSHLSSLDINKSAKNGGSKSYKKSPRDLTYQSSSKSNNITCISDLIIHGDFTIHNGSFSAPSEMRVRRDWVNNVGEAAFIENTGLVTFFGAVDSEIHYDEVFYNLNNEKDFDVRYLRTAENLNINVLNDLHLNQGVFFTETGNTVEIGNTVEFLEEASWWAGNAAISIAGDWNNQSTAPGVYSGFRAQSSSVTFDGLADQYLSCDYAIEEFNNLEINKTGGLGNDAFIPNANVRVITNLEVVDGHWSDIPDGNAHEFFGDVNVGIDGKWTDPIGIVNLLGPTNKLFYNNGDGYFDVIMFNRDNPTDQVFVGGKLEFNYLNLFTGTVQLAKNNYLNHSAIYVDANGSLNFEAGASLISDPGAAITIYAGGKVAFNGINSDYCVVTINGGPGYYYFNIEGEIAAEYTNFSNMSADGISVLPDGLVDPLQAFNNCSFSYGESGGTYLAVNSNQNLTCDGATFHSNSWGGNSNVRKITDEGGIIFTNYSGDFAGEDYEDDPFGRIHWDDGSREIDLKVMLEGPFLGVKMMTTINLEGYLPTSQPYNTSPWNYTGTESVASIPNTLVVDWILIEYRDAGSPNSATPSTTIGRQAAFLLNDGSIVDLDGISILDFSYTINDNLFVVLHHRNHLSIMSATPVTETGFIYTYDFTSSLSQAYGANAMKDLGSGTYGMIGGDANADRTINTEDKTFWSNQVGIGGYLLEDLNLDGQVMNQDKNEVWIENTGNSSQIPN